VRELYRPGSPGVGEAILVDEALFVDVGPRNGGIHRLKVLEICEGLVGEISRTNVI